ncbi:ABC transporter permease [Micromonospora endophytica]|uniref:ABC transporter permease n=1 Tax=Micromonospora endophytica TaxID=515350 RepID=A0A2W2E115_9ACTN|nr:ABC transporter permease [Micromonospora endophytica]RIW45273.1 FtsX-like permease family protein [Micromonospora endophytica]
MAKLAVRNLLAHRARFLFTAMAVTLGVAFVSGTMIFRDTASQSFGPLFERRAQAETITVRGVETITVRGVETVSGEGAPPPTVPAEVLATLDQKVTDAEVYGQIEGYSALVRDDGSIVGEDVNANLGGAFTPRPGATLTLLSGREPAGADEIVVETRTATEGQVKVGDSYTVVAQRDTRRMKVVGIFELQDDDIGRVVTYIGYSPAVAHDLLTGSGNYSAIFLNPRQGISQQQVLAQVRPLLTPQYEATTPDQQAEQFEAELKDLFALLSRFLLAFAGVSVVVSSFIIFNTFTMLIAQRTRELALLRALGAGRAQVTRAVLAEGLGVGLLGATLGLVAGVGVSFLLRLLFTQFAGTQLPIRAPVVASATVFWSYLVGVLVTVAAAYVPARRASRIPPMAALRDDVAEARRTRLVRLVLGLTVALFGGAGLAGGIADRGADGAALVVISGVILLLAAAMVSPCLGRPVIRVLGWPIARLAGAVGRMSRENARRDPRRSAATASALMVGLALVSVATVLATSMSASAEADIDRQFGADYTIEPRGLTGFKREVVEQVAAVPGVRTVTPLQIGSLQVGREEMAAVVADARALSVPTNLTILEGSATLGPDDILVQRSLAESKAWQVGSTVAGKYPDGKPATFRVGGIFADNKVVGRSIMIHPDGYTSHAPTTLIQKAFIDFDDARAATALAGVRETLRAYPNVDLQDREDAKAAARQGIDQILAVVVVLLVLSIAIAALGIVNTLGLSVIERTREIGLLRAVGMARSQVAAMIRYEAVMIALFGAVLGVGLGAAVGWALQRAMADEVSTLDVPVGRLGLYLLAAIVIAVVAALWPARRASKMNVLQAIHNS